MSDGISGEMAALSGGSRLLTICHGYPPYYGGAEHVAAYLAREACADGDSFALASDIGGRLAHDETLDGVRVLRVPARKKEWTRHTSGELLSFHWSARRRMDRLIGDLQPGYVLAHFAYPAGAVALAIHSRFGIPYAVVLHGSDVPGYQSSRFGLVYPMYAPVFRHVCEQAEHVIAVSDELADLAGRSWRGDIKVIRNGVDVQRFCPPASPRTESSALRVAVTAQLIARKGLDILVDALETMPAGERAGFDVHVYGEGPHRAHLEQRIAAGNLDACMHLDGLLKADEVPDMLRSADLFALPSFQEGLPLSLLEAMATGLTVIATRVGGIPSVLRDRENALLIDPGDAAGLRGAMRVARDDPGLRARMGAEARHAAEAMSWKDVWNRYRRMLFPAPEYSLR